MSGIDTFEPWKLTQGSSMKTASRGNKGLWIRSLIGVSVASFILSSCTQTQAPTTQAPAKKNNQVEDPDSDEELGLGAEDNKTVPDASQNTAPSNGSSAAVGNNNANTGSVITAPPRTETPSANNGGNQVIIGPAPSSSPQASAPAPNVINAGRGDRKNREAYKPVPAGYSPTQVQTWVSAHSAQNPGFKYVFLTPAAAANRETANTLRVAVAKAWNHLSWKPEISIPVDISEGTGLVFALNLQEIWGTGGTANWNFLAACSAKRNIQISPAPRGDCQAFNADQPVAAERFVFNAVHGGPYANIHKTPPSFSSFRQKYSLGPIVALSTQKDAIVCGPRITAFRLAFEGIPQNQIPKYSNVQEAIKLLEEGKGYLYSYSSDEFDGRDNGDINYTNAPTERDQRNTGALRAAPGDNGTAIASEWWMQLPNGFMYWGIHGEGSQERGKGEFPFAIDPANWKQGAALAVARSCITCHIKGNQAALSDPGFEGKNGWTSNTDLTILNLWIIKRFAQPLEKITLAMSDDEGPLNEKFTSGTIEPIKQAIMLVEGPYTGRGLGTCNSFCNGKFGSRRKNMCETLPAR
jgi:hypothetical protein